MPVTGPGVWRRHTYRDRPVSTQIIRSLLSQALFLCELASAPRSGAGLGRVFGILGIGKGRKIWKLGRFSISNIFIRYVDVIDPTPYYLKEKTKNDVGLWHKRVWDFIENKFPLPINTKQITYGDGILFGDSKEDGAEQDVEPEGVAEE